MRKLLEALKWALPVLLLTCGAGYAAAVCYGYAKGRLEYAHLKENYTRIIDETDRGGMEISSHQPEDEEKEDAMQKKTIWKPLADPLPEDAPPKIAIDWDGLERTNSDVIAWILVPAADISYPVVQGEDNEYYLHRGLNREYLYAGSVFMDAYNNASFYNYNTVIYGHNMRDGSMFAGLKDFTDEKTYKKCPYFWILTRNADYLYKICSIHEALSGSDTFALRFADYEEYKLWQDKMLSLSSPATGETLDYQDRIVTLSTCTENISMRMTVQGKLVWKTS